MTFLKVCERGSAGTKNREEVYELAKSMIRDNPLKPGFKTGYKETASYLNKHGYRDSNGVKWKAKVLSDFYHHYHYKGIKTSTITYAFQDLVKCIIDSDLDSDLKLRLIPIVLDFNR